MEKNFIRSARRPYRALFLVLTAITLALAAKALALTLSHAASPVTISTGADVERLGPGKYVSIDYLYMFSTGYHIKTTHLEGEQPLSSTISSRVYLAELEDEEYLIVLLDPSERAGEFMGAYTGRLVRPAGVQAEIVEGLTTDVARSWGLTEQEARALLHTGVVMQTGTGAGGSRTFSMWITASVFGIACVLVLAVILNPRMTRAYRRLAKTGRTQEVFVHLDRAAREGGLIIREPGFAASSGFVLIDKWAAPAGELMWIYGRRRLRYGLRFYLTDGTRGSLSCSRATARRILEGVSQAMPWAMVGYDPRLAGMRFHDLKWAWELYKAREGQPVVS